MSEARRRTEKSFWTRLHSLLVRHAQHRVKQLLGVAREGEHGERAGREAAGGGGDARAHAPEVDCVTRLSRRVERGMGATGAPPSARRSGSSPAHSAARSALGGGMCTALVVRVDGGRGASSGARLCERSDAHAGARLRRHAAGHSGGAPAGVCITQAATPHRHHYRGKNRPNRYLFPRSGGPADVARYSDTLRINKPSETCLRPSTCESGADASRGASCALPFSRHSTL